MVDYTFNVETLAGAGGDTLAPRLLHIHQVAGEAADAAGTSGDNKMRWRCPVAVAAAATARSVRAAVVAGTAAVAAAGTAILAHLPRCGSWPDSDEDSLLLLRCGTEKGSWGRTSGETRTPLPPKPWTGEEGEERPGRRRRRPRPRTTEGTAGSCEKDKL